MVNANWIIITLFRSEARGSLHLWKEAPSKNKFFVYVHRVKMAILGWWCILGGLLYLVFVESSWSIHFSLHQKLNPYILKMCFWQYNNLG